MYLFRWRDQKEVPMASNFWIDDFIQIYIHYVKCSGFSQKPMG